MLINITSIRDSRIIPKPIRIDQLVEDISLNGLHNPIKVLLMTKRRYYLIDGRKRLDSALQLGWEVIEADILDEKAAEQFILDNVKRIEKCRKLYLIEVIRFGLLIRVIEQQKWTDRAYGEKVEPRAAERKIKSYLNVSDNQFSRILYIMKHAPLELIRKIDSGAQSITTAYKEIRTMESAGILDAYPREHVKIDSCADYAPRVRKPSGWLRTKETIAAANARIAELEEKAQQEYYRANIAEGNIRDLKEAHWNQIYHRDGIIEAQRAQIRDLQTKLANAVALSVFANDAAVQPRLE